MAINANNSLLLTLFNINTAKQNPQKKSADFLTNIYSEARNWGGETVQDKAKQARGAMA